MSWLKTAMLIAQAVLLVLQFVRDRQTAGVATDKALKEITDALNARIDAAAAARRQPDDPGVLHDPFDRDS